MTETAPCAAIYARQSKGSAKSVEEQEGAAREACKEHGWEVYGAYVDLVGASRYSGKPRHDWARLLADLDTGEIRILVLWESSRGDRRARWWMDLLETCFKQDALIHIVDDERTYNLAVATDWRVLASSGVEAEYESRRLSSRIKRDMKANATKGRPHGGILYGYRRVYDEKTGELARQEPHPKQAPVVREIISRVAAGEPVSAVAQDLDRRGIRPARGERWNRASIRNIAMNQAYTGYRRRGGGWIQSSPQWFPPIADEADFWQAEKRLREPSRKTTRPGGIKHLLSYLIQCDACKTPMGIYHRLGPSPYFVYRCNAHGCASIREDWLDAYVTGHVCATLNTDAFWDEMLSGDEPGARKARTEEAQLRSALRDYEEKAIANATLADSFERVAEGLRARIRDAERRSARSSAPPSLMAFRQVRDVHAIRAMFEARPLGVRRDIIAGLYARIIITPAGVSRRVPDRERVRIVPKGGGA